MTRYDFCNNCHERCVNLKGETRKNGLINGRFSIGKFCNNCGTVEIYNKKFVKKVVIEKVIYKND